MMHRLVRPARLALTALALVLGATAARAQGFHALYSTDGTSVYAVGDTGRVFRSLDSGANWTSGTVGTATYRGIAAHGFDVVIVGTAGNVWRSQNSGGSWAQQILPGAPDLYGIDMPTASVGYVVGSGGTITKTIDGGTTWTPQSSGVGVTLRAVRFIDDQQGWAVGDGGTVLHTNDGGAAWSPVSVGTTTTLLDVDARGSSVWIVGARGVAKRSIDGGTNWAPVNLKLDAHVDVRSVWLQPDGTIYLAGGGGFIRRSTNGGNTWTFLVHTLQHPATSAFFVGNKGWLASNKTRVVMRTTNAGDSWSMPSGASVSRSWSRRQRVNGSGGSPIGNGFATGPTDKTLYCALTDSVYVSRDEGESWTAFSKIPNSQMTHAFLVSPTDSMLMVATATTGNDGTDRIVRSTNGGATWTDIMSKPFSNYGIPIEMHPEKPDTLYFSADASRLYRSTNFGVSWSQWSTSPATFRSPCDIEVVPDSGNVILIGDGITGSGDGRYYKSTDNGLTFALISEQTGSEIPSLATTRLRKNQVFGTNWSSGGVQRSDDFGSSWPDVASTSSAWGIDVAGDDPNVVSYGVYSGGTNYYSFDAGENISSLSLPGSPPDGPAGSNYGVLVRDRATVLLEQNGGIYKLRVTTSLTPSTPSQSISLSSPNGGEVWQVGDFRTITWSAQDVALARIEYQHGTSDAWQLVADVAGYAGSYLWTVPADPTTTARVRVRDAWDSSPSDQSTGTFTIQGVSLYAATPDPLDFGDWNPGATAIDSFVVVNAGSIPLTISSITGGHPEFWLGRTSLVVAAGGNDTIGVFYNPQSAGHDISTWTVTSSDTGSPHTLTAEGTGRSNVAVGGPERPTAFALWQNQPNPFARSTLIRYALPTEAPVSLQVYGLQGQHIATLVDGVRQAGVHSVDFGPHSGVRNRTLPSGVYFVRFRAGSFSGSRKMLLMR